MGVADRSTTRRSGQTQSGAAEIRDCWEGAGMSTCR